MPLPHKAEAEYAYVLHWLLTLALEHPEDWRRRAGQRLTELKPAHARRHRAAPRRARSRQARLREPGGALMAGDTAIEWADARA